MAIGDAYATAVEYRAAKKKGSASEDTVIGRQLLAVSRYIERVTGQFFNKDATAVARLYVPSQFTRCLVVDPIASVSGLSIKVDTDRDGSFADETAWDSGDYQLLPLNADKGPEAQPWREIYVPAWSSQAGFSAGEPVEVTAAFGWPAVPASIVELTMELCAIWRAESPRSTGRMDELEQVIGASNLAMGLVKRLTDAYWMPVIA